MRGSVMEAGVFALGLAAMVGACSSAQPTTSESKPIEVGGTGTIDSSKITLPIVPATKLPLGVMPMRKADIANAPIGANYCTKTTGAQPQLTYFGGAVLQNPEVVNVNWSSHVNATIQSQMPKFYADIVDSPYMDWLSEYNTIGVNGSDGAPGTNQGIARGTYGGSVTLTPSRCAGTTSCTVSDTQVSAELLAQINAGTLPKPVAGCDGYSSTIYMVNFPANVTITGPSGSGTSCVQFCGYHFTFHYNNLRVAYSVLPAVDSGPCGGGGCGSNVNFVDNATAIATHELIEATTDEDVGDIPPAATGYARPAGWGDNTCGEIGDICAYIDGTIAGKSGTTWTVQQEWSNVQNDCVTTRTPPAICTGPNTPAGCRPCSCSDNAINCKGATPWCETSNSNIKYGECVQCTQSSQCSAGATCQKTNVIATDDTCSGGCTPKTTCPAGQNCGQADDGCGGKINCGTCNAPQSCGGGGTPNQCGCTPKTTCPAGQDCGQADNGCGGKINCGSCNAPQTCGGSGTPNKCGCTPKTTCPAGMTCGQADDGCGGKVSCGTCGANETCDTSSNTCVSNAQPDSGAADSSAPDSSASGDASTSKDSGSTQGGNDSGSADDASATDNDAGDQSSASSSSNAGCGCRTAQPKTNTMSASLLGLGAVGLVGAARIRRRRRAR